MKHFAIARPYAVAAFEYAIEHKNADAWLTALKAIAMIVAEPQVKAAIHHPEVENAQIQDFLCELLKSDLDAHQLNFLKLLVENKRLDRAAEIVVLFEELLAESEKVLQAKLSTVMEVDDAIVSSIRDALEAKFSHKIELETEIDESLIGGAVIRSKDWVIDASVRGQLEQMAKELIVKG